MTEIKGRAAVVTGSGSGIGKGLAIELAKQGASVAVADIILDNARKVADQINASGGKAIAVQCDVCERSSIAAMKEAATEALGPVSLVFANAGATSFDALTDMSDADVDWIIQVNLMGVMNTTRAFLPDIIKAGKGGHLMATASMAGLLPGWIPVHVPYSAAKMGIIGMMMNLALELKQHDIYTTSYCPGGVATGMKVNNASYRPAKFGGPGNAEVHVSEESFKNISLRFYTPEQIAPMVLRAVKNNRPFVFDHANQRRNFRETYANIVEACYDDIEDYELEHGIPEGNPPGPVLLEKK
jgi:NAD(P)-dependent dehydrogenase (short-subunit alcohol dehydrogenase family)